MFYDGGVHMCFLVNGSSAGVMGVYKAALEGNGWTLSVQSAGGGHGGGAVFSGINGSVYGVLTGGGYGSTTDLNACVWLAKPVNTVCGNHC